MICCKNYCEEEGISTSKLNEAQKTLYYIVENMKLSKSISEEGYRHFQMAIKALGQESVLNKIRAEIDNINLNEVATKYEDRFYGFQREVIKIIDKYKAEMESEK